MVTEEQPTPPPAVPTHSGPDRPPGRFDDRHPTTHYGGLVALTLGALGVVFGDIGTSPLYAMQTIFTADNHAVKTSNVEVYGVISLVEVAAVISTILLTWQRGRVIVTRNRTEEEGPLQEFVQSLREMQPPLQRVPGTAVFLNANVKTTPLALRANVEHNRTLHTSVVIFSVQFERVPHVPDGDRLVLDDLVYRDDGIAHVTAHFGFQDRPDVPRALRLPAMRDLEVEIDVDDASYFLSRMTIVRTRAIGMPAWQKRLFLTLAHNAANPAEYFGLPIDRSISMCAQVGI